MGYGGSFRDREDADADEGSPRGWFGIGEKIRWISRRLGEGRRYSSDQNS
jgi:hypothetical protein